MPQEIIFTTLPHHRTEINGQPFLKVSVYTTIKLSTPKNTTLTEFEDILKFPHKILAASFRFRLGNNTESEAQLEKEKIDIQLFENIFHKDIKVDDFKDEDMSKKNIYSFPQKHINDFVLSSFAQVAMTSPKNLVSPEKFVDDTKFGAISRMKLDVKTLEQVEQPGRRINISSRNLYFKNDNDDNALRKEVVRNKFTPFAKQINPRNDFAQLRQFHKVDKKIIVRKTPVVLEKPRFEFHDIVSVINSYPQLLRKLGFILDFLIPYNSSIPNSGKIGLVVDSLELNENETTVSMPLTAYNLTPLGFYIGDKSGSIFK